MHPNRRIFLKSADFPQGWKIHEESEAAVPREIKRGRLSLSWFAASSYAVVASLVADFTTDAENYASLGHTRGFYVFTADNKHQAPRPPPWPSVDKLAYRVTVASTRRNNFTHNHGEMLKDETRGGWILLRRWRFSTM